MPTMVTMATRHRKCLFPNPWQKAFQKFYRPLGRLAVGTNPMQKELTGEVPVEMEYGQEPDALVDQERSLTKKKKKTTTTVMAMMMTMMSMLLLLMTMMMMNVR
jgi:hypothetical protein